MGNINNGVLDGVRRIGAKVRDLTVDGGLPGAPMGFRLRGATKAGPPTIGTWKAGDEVRDRTGAIWIATTNGTGLAANWLNPLRAAPNVVFDGDSLTAGTGALPFGNFPLGNDYPSQVVASLDHRGTYWNVGVGGETTLTMIANAPTAVDAKYVPGANNVVCFNGGTNDILGGATDVTTYNRIVTYCQARQAAGWKVVVGTITPRSDSGVPGSQDTYRLSVNTMIRANWPSFANGIADIGADANMGTLGQELNTQYYNGDNVHSNPNGYRVRAGYFLAALSSLGIAGHQHGDRSGLVSDKFISAAEMAATSGSPTLAIIGAYPTWSLHHGSVDCVSWTGLLPQDWLTAAAYMVWTNTAGATGNAVILLRYGTWTVNTFGSSPSNLLTTMTSGGNQVVASPTGDRPAATAAVVTLTANNGDSPRVAWNIGVERNGLSGSDTLTGDVVGLLGVYLYRAT